MAGKDDAEEATFDPTPQKLRKLREEGQVPRSQELVDAITLLAVLGYLVAMSDLYLDAFARLFTDLPVFEPLPLVDRIGASVGMLTHTVLVLVVPPAAIAMFAAIVGTMIDTGGFLFSLKALAPNFARFNPAEGFKKIFKARSAITLVQATVKIAVFSACIVLIVRAHVNDALWAPTCGIDCVMGVGASALMRIMLVGALLLVVFAAVDVVIARWSFIRDNRMTLTEMKREMKESYGDPHVRGERDAERKRIAQMAGLVGPNAANLWIVGPDGAFGIAYKPEESGVPIVAVKAAGAAVSGALEQARARGVEIMTDEALFAALREGSARVGQPIPRATYGAVAQALVRAGFSG